MIRVLDSAGSTLVEWGRQQQQQHDDDRWGGVMVMMAQVLNAGERDQRHICGKSPQQEGGQHKTSDHKTP